MCIRDRLYTIVLVLFDNSAPFTRKYFCCVNVVFVYQLVDTWRAHIWKIQLFSCAELRGYLLRKLIVDCYSRRSVFAESDKNALIWLAVNTIVFTPKASVLLKYLVFYQIFILGSGLCDVSTSVKNNWKVNNYNNFLIKRPIVTWVMSLNYIHFPL